jgi:hypothetical protein
MRIYNGLVLMRPNASDTEADKAEAISATQDWYRKQFTEPVADEWLKPAEVRFIPKIADTAFNRNWYGKEWVAMPNRYFVQLAGPHG